MGDKYRRPDTYGILSKESPEARIARMEKIFDKAQEILNKASEDPKAFKTFQSEIKKLEEYYTGADWKDDFALDEEGRLPKDLKRGVLSEDGIYNLLERNREISEEV